MDQCHLAFEPFNRGRQGFKNIAKEQVIIIWNAFRMGGNLTIKHIDFPVGHDFTQMIKCATVAKANFQNDPVLILDHVRGRIQAVALGLQAADNTVEA